MLSEYSVAVREVLRNLRHCRCRGCFEVIPFKTASYCYRCDSELGNPTSGTYGPYLDDPGPAWENMVRAYEEGLPERLHDDVVRELG